MDSIEKIKSLKLQNKRVLVDLYKPSDAEEIKEIFYDEILIHLEIILEKNKSKFEAYIDYLNFIHHHKKNTLTFVCKDKASGKIAGCTQLKYIDLVNLKLEMGGTWYGKKYQGSGLNQATKLILFDMCFTQLNIRRIQFSIDSDNISSKKSMTKIGAKYEGHFRNNWVDQQSNSRDDDYYSIIHNEWDEIRQKYFLQYV
jgi:RimJ/RimL family protein N-acetyltransferase